MAKVIQHGTRKHALLSASGASRWLNCTPSARLEEKFENVTSEYAAEGTLAHEFADIGVRFLTKQLSEKEYNESLAIFRKHHLYTDEMEDEVQKHIDYVMEQFTEAKRLTPDAYLAVEEKIDLTDYIEEGFGTGDDMIIGDGIMEVADLKYGKGIRVSAKENSQLMLYGLGALKKYEMIFDIKVVRLTIIQPRLDSISSWEISVEDLLAWGENQIRPKAIEAYKGNGKFQPGEWCKFCKAKAKCKAFAEDNLKIAKMDFSNLEDDLTDQNELSDSEILAIYEKASEFQSWLNSISEHVHKTALEGKKWSGYKLVQGRSNRKWTDEEKVIDTLVDSDYREEDLYNKKLKGITIIEKQIGKVAFASLLSDLVYKPQGSPTLVPESDKRPALGIDQAIEDFKD